MKRKTKFRAISTDTGKWIYGSFYECEGRAVIIHKQGMNLMQHTDVRPETGGQFTGLYDRNGKEIYEDDIVHIDRDEVAWYVVYGYFGDAKFYVCNGINSGREIEDEQNTWIANITSKEKFELEVIGNIHENPGLIR